MIVLENIFKEYKEKTALKNINLTLPDKGLFFIKGPSGSGKSTLLKLLSLETCISRGKYFYNSKLVNKFTNKEKNEFVSKEITLISQKNDFINTLTIKENLLIFLDDSKNNLDRLNDIFTKFNILEILDKYPYEVSTGQLKRASIARAILRETKMILGDEITASLDLNNKLEILNILKDLSKNILIVIATHDMDILKNEKNIIELNNGLILKKPDIINVNEFRINTNYSYSFNIKKKIKYSLKIFKNNYLMYISIISLSFFFIFIFLFSYLLNQNYKDLYINSLRDNNVSTVQIYKQINDFSTDIKLYPYQTATFYDSVTNYTYQNITFRDSYNLKSGRLPIKEDEYLITNYSASLINIDLINETNLTYKIVGIIDVSFSTKGNDNFTYYNNYINTNGLNALYTTREIYQKKFGDEFLNAYMNISECADLSYVFDNASIYSQIDYDFDSFFDIFGMFLKNDHTNQYSYTVGNIIRILFLIITLIFIFTYFYLYNKKYYNQFMILKYNGIKNKDIFFMYIFKMIINIVLSLIIGLLAFVILFIIVKYNLFKYSNILKVLSFDISFVIFYIVLLVFVISIKPLEILLKKE